MKLRSLWNTVNFIQVASQFLYVYHKVQFWHRQYFCSNISSIDLPLTSSSIHNVDDTFFASYRDPNTLEYIAIPISKEYMDGVV